ncbi:MAG: type II toxin-antitoxin system PemK/MazF family toxin [Caldilineaceae bacterium]
MQTTVSIQEPLLEQAAKLAQRLNVSRNQLFELAIASFIQTHQSGSRLNESHWSIQEISSPTDSTQRTIDQGDIYWIQGDALGQSELGFYAHPYVVIQDNILNHSRINTVVVCALTSNRKQANLPGNIQLEADEANLPQPSTVVVSKVSSVYKTQLGDYVGTLSQRRIEQILAGMRFLQRSFFSR